MPNAELQHTILNCREMLTPLVLQGKGWAATPVDLAAMAQKGPLICCPDLLKILPRVRGLPGCGKCLIRTSVPQALTGEALRRHSDVCREESFDWHCVQRLWECSETEAVVRHKLLHVEHDLFTSMVFSWHEVLLMDEEEWHRRVMRGAEAWHAQNLRAHLNLICSEIRTRQSIAREQKQDRWGSIKAWTPSLPVFLHFYSHPSRRCGTPPPPRERMSTLLQSLPAASKCPPTVFQPFFSPPPRIVI